MKFMPTFTIPSNKAKRNEAIARFQKTGGQPPQGPSCWDAGPASISAAGVRCRTVKIRRP